MTLMRAAGFGALLLISASGCTSDPAPKRATAAPPASSEECRELDEMIARTRRGYVPVRSPDIALIPTEPNYIGKASLPVHTGPWDYLAEVPLVFYGPGVVAERGRVATPRTLADVAPMIADLIGTTSFRAPHGRADPALADGGEKPALVVAIVWDGAGRNTLREHPDSWPTLKRLMSRGASYSNATIGSTPSNTPPIHTTIGTGAFPSTHGVPHVRMRTASGGYVDPYEGDDASEVRVPTLGDVYDASMRNRPEVGVVATVNWHLGMIGHGGQLERGDRDVAVLLNDQGLSYGNDEIYDVVDAGDSAVLAATAERLDVADGKRDGRWNEEDLGEPAIRYATPAFTEYQQGVLERVIADRGFGADHIPDLMFVNFKQIDDAGHKWGLTSDQVGADVAAADQALDRLLGFLDERVGERRWAVVVTADHGQSLYPEESGGWPISGRELKNDIEAAFAADGMDVLRVVSSGVFLAADDAIADGSAGRVARWVGDYTVAENVADGRELPAAWEGRENERLFSAVLAGREVAASICE